MHCDLRFCKCVNFNGTFIQDTTTATLFVLIVTHCVITKLTKCIIYCMSHRAQTILIFSRHNSTFYIIVFAYASKNRREHLLYKKPHNALICFTSLFYKAEICWFCLSPNSNKAFVFSICVISRSHSANTCYSLCRCLRTNLDSKKSKVFVWLLAKRCPPSASPL